MSKVKKAIIKLIEDEGALGALEIFQEALSDYADEMSDLGLKEKAYEAADLVDVLNAMVLANDSDDRLDEIEDGDDQFYGS